MGGYIAWGMYNGLIPAVIVGTEPCAPGDDARQVAVWWVCRGTVNGER